MRPLVVVQASPCFSCSGADVLLRAAADTTKASQAAPVGGRRQRQDAVMRRQRSDSACADSSAEHGDQLRGSVRMGQRRVASQHSSRKGSYRALVLCAVVIHTMGLSRAGHSADHAVMSGQLTWEIDRKFAHPLSPQRRVTFTLLTAFEMDPKCDYSGDVVHCPADHLSHGVLCVDQYRIKQHEPGTGAFVPELDGSACNAATNNTFRIVSTRHINGLNIVFGKLEHTVTAKDDSVAMIAYLKGRKPVLPQCQNSQSNITDTVLPCAVNVDDPLYRFRTVAGYDKDADRGFEEEPYWKSINSDYVQPQQEQKGPLFEVYVRLCPKSGVQSCGSSETAFHIKNFYSPVPHIPAFVEVAVTAYTQRADSDNMLAEKQNWTFNGSSGVIYYAPHPAFQVTSYDLDGHQMTQVSGDWGIENIERFSSNLALECFSNVPNGKTWPFMDVETETDAAFQHAEMREKGSCRLFFDMDRSGGSTMKFDFNFGSNNTAGRYYREGGNLTESVIFGNDLNRCRGPAGMEILACNPLDGVCVDPNHPEDTKLMSACSGNLMFTHHLVNTVDLPWMDVDNVVAALDSYTVPQPLWSTLIQRPASAMVKTMVSAYMCFAGTANQPPRFMKNLDAVPNVTDWLRVPGVTPADYLKPEDTEITCTVGEPCIFPIYAQDFVLNEAGQSCIDQRDPMVTMGIPEEACAFAANEDETARYQSNDVVRIEMAPGWEMYDPLNVNPLNDYEGEESEGADLVTAYCSDDEAFRGCVRDSDCPEGTGTCTGYKRNDGLAGVQTTPGYCINPVGYPEGQGYNPPVACRTDFDCPSDSKCAIPACESYGLVAETGSVGGLGSVKCFYKEYFKPQHEGKIVTRCFVATDPQGDRHFANDTFFEARPDHPRMWDGTCNRLGTTYRPGTGYGNDRIVNPLVPAVPASGNDYNGCEQRAPKHVQSNYARTCKSMPVCFKIKVEGRAPRFEAPTPLEANSYDDNGALVYGRTDVPACEGHELQLAIKASDPDGDDVRIFVEDKEEDKKVASQLDIYLKGDDLLGGGTDTYNLDFFNKSTLNFLPAQVGNSATSSRMQQNFEPYGADRAGHNSDQDTILALDAASAKSIASAYAGNVEYSPIAEQNIKYTLDAGSRNGIMVRSASAEGFDDPQNCRFTHDNTTDSSDTRFPRCREKLLNMDQTICAFAYDNSRNKSGRWVGRTDPNGKAQQFCFETGRPSGTPAESSAKMYVAGNSKNTDMPWLEQCSGDREQARWMRDHSNGDMASAMHCWRIRLQAPPVFVTDPSKVSTPFPAAYDLAAYAGNFASSPVEAEAVTPIVQVEVGKQFSWTFVAQDPNVGDTVQILILDDPGMPAQMRAGVTECLPRSGAGDMFAAGDTGWSTQIPTKMVGKASQCSKAKLDLTWTPPEEASGQTFKVCAVAKDFSTACAGIADAERATSRGWLGEVQCLELVVSAPVIVFDIELQEIDSFVGCMTRVKLVAKDTSSGRYDVKILIAEALPAGGYLTKQEVGVGSVTQYMEWVPQRGMEGRKFRTCFTAIDAYEIQQPTDPVCYNFSVQKCQYCLDGKDTLSLLMKDFGLDTNWLRVWLHNGNSHWPEATPRVDNPDLIMSSHAAFPQGHPDSQSLAAAIANSRRQPIVWAGVMYQVGVGESLLSVASRFKTTVAGLLSVNPDLSAEDDISAEVAGYGNSQSTSISTLSPATIKAADLDGSGSIDYAEFSQMADNQGRSDPELKSIFNSMDINSDGTLKPITMCIIPCGQRFPDGEETAQ